MTLANGSIITTPYGLGVDLSELYPDMIEARDLAHLLSRRECRGGNTELPSYSVAQHCLLSARACRLPASRPYALLYRAPAAYLGWMEPELKWWLLEHGSDIIGLERRLFGAMLERFNLPAPSDAVQQDVDQAEQRVDATEWRDVLRGKPAGRLPAAPPLPTRITFKPPFKAQDEYWVALERELRPYCGEAA
ncbi:hypothetical protein [Devosia sp. 1635]|uniref:hypothetical protein n=1 Tax=Devosia sp. 1635 TaxID=2726066 RepID=UPI001563EC29|nr:hypothetical protein [Devosia sp. 1635]